MRVHFFVKLFFSGIFLVFPHGSIVLFDIRRKMVRPVVLRNEVKVRDGSRVDSGEEGVSSRVTDRGGGKSRKEIGVIRSGSHQVFFG